MISTISNINIFTTGYNFVIPFGQIGIWILALRAITSKLK
jgi:hypothetical protein